MDTPDIKSNTATEAEQCHDRGLRAARLRNPLDLRRFRDWVERGLLSALLGLLIFFDPLSGSAQVRILERVDVRPTEGTPRSSVQKATVQGVIRFETTWDNPQVDVRVLAWGPGLNNENDCVYGPPPSISLTTKALRGRYGLTPQSSVFAPGAYNSVTNSIYVNDSLVAQTYDSRWYDWQLFWGNGCGIVVGFTCSPAYHLHIYPTPNSIAHGDTTVVIVVAEDASNSEVELPGNENVDIGVDSTTFGRFVDPNGNRFQWLNDVPYQNARNGLYQFVADGSGPARFGTTQTRIWSTGQDMLGSSPLWVSKSPDSLRVTVSPDTVLHGDTSTVTVTAIDSAGNPRYLSPETPFILSVDSTRYGRFIDAAGVVVSSPLTDVRYADAHDGKVKFLADGVNPRSLPLPGFRLRASGAGMAAAAWLWVNGTVLHLEVGRDTLRTLRDYQNVPDPTDPEPDPKKKRFVLDSTRVDTTMLSVRITDLLNRPGGIDSLTIEACTRPMSGGHDHPAGSDAAKRPSGRFEIAVGQRVAIARLQTDEEGSARVIFCSSGIGGIDSLRARSKKGDDSAAISISLLVDSLQVLGPGSHYELIGEYSPPNVTSRHSLNHHGVRKLRNAVAWLADTIFALKQKKIRVNDMSLASGGPFDVKNGWHPPHQGHREGIEVDIDDVFFEGGALPERLLKTIASKSPFKRASGETVKYEGNHYHLSFR